MQEREESQLIDTIEALKPRCTRRPRLLRQVPKLTSRVSLPSAPAAADPETCISSMASSTVTARACPCLGSPRIFHPSEIGSGYFQETHPERLFTECSHYCELISGANQMPRTLEIAIHEAVAQRGVSVVIMPGDVALQTASDAPTSQGRQLCFRSSLSSRPPTMFSTD